MVNRNKTVRRPTITVTVTAHCTLYAVGSWEWTNSRRDYVVYFTDKIEVVLAGQAKDLSDDDIWNVMNYIAFWTSKKKGGVVETEQWRYQITTIGDLRVN